MKNSYNKKTISLTEKEKDLLRAYGEDIDSSDYEVYEIVENEEENNIVEEIATEIEEEISDDIEIYESDREYKKELRRQAREEKRKAKEEKRREKRELRALKEKIKNEVKEDIKEEVTEQVIEEIKEDTSLNNYVSNVVVDSYEEPTIEETEEENVAYYNYNFYNEMEDVVNKKDTNDENYSEEETIDNYRNVEVKKTKRINKNKTNTITNIILIIVLLIIAFITIDVIRVKKYDKLPLFAIPLKTYDDGGTKAYYGLGYKVFDYYKLQGKKGKEIGTWFMKYNTKPDYTLNAIDLAIEVNTNEEKAFKKYYNKYIQVDSTLKSIEKSSNEITTGYEDEDNKYTLDIVCSMSSAKEELKYLEVDNKTKIVGTVKEFDYETGTNPSTLFLVNCSAEQ